MIFNNQKQIVVLYLNHVVNIWNIFRDFASESFQAAGQRFLLKFYSYIIQN